MSYPCRAECGVVAKSLGGRTKHEKSRHPDLYRELEAGPAPGSDEVPGEPSFGPGEDPDTPERSEEEVEAYEAFLASPLDLPPVGAYDDVRVIFSCGHGRRTIGARLVEHEEGTARLKCLTCRVPRPFEVVEPGAGGAGME